MVSIGFSNGFAEDVSERESTVQVTTGKEIVVPAWLNIFYVIKMAIRLSNGFLNSEFSI